MHYISYYQQFLKYLYEHAKNSIKAKKNDIDNFYRNQNSIETNLYSHLKDNLESELKNNLLKCTKNTSFQVQGGFDKYGFILNHKDTLKTILKLYNSKIDLEIEPKPYYALA